MTDFQFVQGQTIADSRRSSAFRWALLFVGPVVLCATIAVIVSSLMPSIYAARAEIIFQPVGDEDISEAYKATQSVIITGQAVLGQTALTLDRSIDDLAAAFTVSFPKGGAVMHLQFADADPGTAANSLNVILDRYLLVLDGLDVPDQPTHRLMVPPFLLGDPILPRPMQALVMGIIVGLAIAMAAFAIVRRPRSDA